MKTTLILVLLLAFVNGCVFYAKGLDLQFEGTLVRDESGNCYVMKTDTKGKAFLTAIENCPEKDTKMEAEAEAATAAAGEAVAAAVAAAVASKAQSFKCYAVSRDENGILQMREMPCP